MFLWFGAFKVIALDLFAQLSCRDGKFGNCTCDFSTICEYLTHHDIYRENFVKTTTMGLILVLAFPTITILIFSCLLL